MEKGCALDFYNGKDDLMNFKLKVTPDDGIYKGGTFVFRRARPAVPPALARRSDPPPEQLQGAAGLPARGAQGALRDDHLPPEHRHGGARARQPSTRDAPRTTISQDQSISESKGKTGRALRPRPLGASTRARRPRRDVRKAHTLRPPRACRNAPHRALRSA